MDFSYSVCSYAQNGYTCTIIGTTKKRARQLIKNGNRSKSRYNDPKHRIYILNQKSVKEIPYPVYCGNHNSELIIHLEK